MKQNTDTEIRKKVKVQGRLIFDMDAMTIDGKVRFRCRNVKYDGYEKFRLCANPKNMKRIDREFDSEEQARSFYHRWQANNDPIGQGYRTVATKLNNAQLQDATDAFDRLPDGATLLELVKHFDLTKQTRSVCLLEAWNEYRDFNIHSDSNRDGSWRSKATIIEQDFVFKPILSQLGSHLVKDLVAEDLSPFWQSRASSQTRLNHYKKIKAFFSWCLKKEYHFKDILALEKTPKVEKDSFPQVLTLFIAVIPQHRLIMVSMLGRSFIIDKRCESAVIGVFKFSLIIIFLIILNFFLSGCSRKWNPDSQFEEEIPKPWTTAHYLRSILQYMLFLKMKKRGRAHTSNLSLQKTSPYLP